MTSVSHKSEANKILQRWTEAVSNAHLSLAVYQPAHSLISVTRGLIPKALSTPRKKRHRRVLRQDSVDDLRWETIAKRTTTRELMPLIPKRGEVKAAAYEEHCQRGSYVSGEQRHVN